MMGSKHEGTFKTAKPRLKSGKSASAEEFSYGTGQSSLGPILVASSRKGVVSILIGDTAAQLVEDLHARFPKAHIVRDDRDSADLVKAVIEFIEAPANGLDLRLDIRGTPFQQRVWQAVREIPPGEITTFTEIARTVGAPRAMRAVGNACLTNNLEFAVPCHRVARKDGSHFRDRQRVLLRREMEPESGQPALTSEPLPQSASAKRQFKAARARKGVR